MRRKRLYLSAALMCGFFCFAFTFNSSHVQWLWADAIPAAVVLALASVAFALLWYRESKRA